MITITDLKQQRNELAASIAGTQAQIDAIENLIITMQGKATAKACKTKKAKKKVNVSPTWAPSSKTVTWAILPVIERLVRDHIGDASFHNIRARMRINGHDTNDNSLRSMLNQLVRSGFVSRDGKGQTPRYTLTLKGVELVKMGKKGQSK